MPEPRRLAVIRQGDRPRINAALSGLLARVYPDHQIDDIDVLDAVRGDRMRSARSLASAVVEYPVPLARRRTTLKRAVLAASGFAAGAHHVVEDRVSPETHRFTFQSQSLFPGAVRGVPHFVYTDHAHLANLGYPGFDRSDLKSARSLRREADLYHAAELVFTRSEHVRQTIIHGYGQGAERVVTVGVGPNTERPSTREPRSWHGGRILFVGVDWARKGGPDLLSAFRRVRERHPDARLDIVGCSPAGVGGEREVVHGRISLDQTAALFAAADVFCLPTLAEPFGVAYIEAMHAGLPVVGTAIGAVPEFVIPDETGELVRPADVDGLTHALNRLLDDPERAIRLGSNGRALALGRYDWDVVMATIRRHIEVALASRSVAP